MLDITYYWKEFDYVASKKCVIGKCNKEEKKTFICHSQIKYDVHIFDVIKKYIHNVGFNCEYIYIPGEDGEEMLQSKLCMKDGVWISSYWPWWFWWSWSLLEFLFEIDAIWMMMMMKKEIDRIKCLG